MPKKEAQLLRMFDTIQAKDETLIKGKWKRVPEEDVGEVLTVESVGKYRRFVVEETYED